MAELSVYLPPFASDYSGVCSALYDFDCLMVICDAACCTKSYIVYDEPRWSREKPTAFSASLRTIEFALGDESRLIRETAAAARERKPAFAALMGTPVPAVTGMDMNGIAKELEEVVGLPVIGFPTGGFHHYDRGVSMALTALYRRFGNSSAGVIPNSVNLLGLTPLDFGANGNAEKIKAHFQSAGKQVLCTYAYGGSLEDVTQSVRAEENIVLSVSGLDLARQMEREHGIPYTVGIPLPVGGKHEPAVCGDNILLIGEQVFTESLKTSLTAMGFQGAVATAGFFRRDPKIASGRDIPLRSEAELVRLLRSERFDIVVGDDMLSRIPEVRALRHIPVAHPAVSGPLYWETVPDYTGAETEQILNLILCK